MMFQESRFNVKVDRAGAVYLFNTLTGALTGLTNGEHRELDDFLRDESEDADQPPPPWIAELVNDGFLVLQGYDELRPLEDLYEQSRAASGTLSLTIVTSLGCNFDCGYCYEDKHPSIISEDLQRHIVAFVEKRLEHVTGLSVTWFGGEPLLGTKPLLSLSRHFLELCLRRGVEYDASIVTNGYLLTAATAKQLQGHGVRSAQVTVDGPPEVHDKRRPTRGGKGTFWQIVKNIAAAVDSGIGVSVRVNVDKTNAMHTRRLLDILRDAGLSGRIDVYLGHTSVPLAKECFNGREFARVEHQFNVVAAGESFTTPALPQLTGAPCTAVRKNEFVIGSEGELYKCWESVGHRDQVIGNIRDIDSVNVENNKWINFSPFNNAECRACQVLPVCMGGCAQHAMNLLQYADRCNTFRFEHKRTIEQFIDHQNRPKAGTPVDRTVGCAVPCK
jgi:uncharacterized protein